jgi:hypothetical protein
LGLSGQVINPFADPNQSEWVDAELQAIADSIIQLNAENLDGIGFKMEVHAIEKAGKTFFAMSASSLSTDNPNLTPGLRTLLEKKIIPIGEPVFIIDTERKAKKLKFHPAFRHKDIRIKEIFCPDNNKPYHINPTEALKQFYQTLLYIAKNFETGTIVIDSVTDVTNWIRKYIQYVLVQRGAEGSELMEMIRLQPSDWMVRDDIWGWLLPYLQGLKQHIIMTSREKEDMEFEPDPDRPGKTRVRRTGNFSPRRFKDIPFNIDVEFRLMFEYDGHGNKLGRKGSIITSQYDDIIDPAPDSGIIPLRRQELKNPTYVKLVEMICPISHGYLLDEMRAKESLQEQPQEQPAKPAQKKTKKTQQTTEVVEQEDSIV